MLVRAIEVEGLNCFGTRFRLDGLKDSVNILFGPNGIGKSSLLHGISMAFLRPHRSNADSIERFRPWNRALQPAVMVEFEHAGQLYRIWKRFLQKPEAKLARHEAGFWNSFAQGDAAEMVLQDVLKSAGGRAAAAQDTTGFAQILWSMQGQLALPPLGESVVAAIRASVGAQMSAGSKEFERAIAAAYAGVFTGTGRLKGGQNACEQVRLEAQLAAAHTEVAGLRTDVASYEAAVVDISALEPKTAQEAERERSLAGQLEVLQERSNQYAELASTVRELDARQQAAMSAWTGRNNGIQELRAKRNKVNGLRMEIDQAQQQQASVVTATEQAKAALDAAKGVVAGLEARQKAAQEALSKAALATEYVHSARRKEELEHTLGQIVAAKSRIHAAEEERKALRVPASARVQELRSTRGELSELQQRLELARVKLSFTPERDCEIRIQDSYLSAEAGQPLELAGDPNLTFSISGVGEFAIAGPVSDFEATQRKVESHTGWLDAFAQEFGTASLDEIAVRCERDKELHGAIKTDNAVRNNLLAGGTETARSGEAARLAARVQEIEGTRPEWAVERPDPHAMSSAANAESEQVSQALAKARIDETGTQSLHAAAERMLTKWRSNFDSLQNQLVDAKETLAIAEGDGKTDAMREEELNFASAELIVVRRDYGAAVQERTALGADPAPQLEQTKREHTKSGQEHAELLRQLNLRRGRLEQLCAEDPYLQLGRAEERQQELTDRLAAATLKKDALALLKKTLDEVREEALVRVSEPVERAASGYLERICGRPLARIRLNADFASEGAVPDGHLSGDCVKEDRLSGGEREQIHLCTRLALAAELSRTERQLLILDDVLAVTDAQRMERINELIEECGKNLQILILTCHPERFQSMRLANFVDLAALICGARKEVA